MKTHCKHCNRTVCESSCAVWRYKMYEACRAEINSFARKTKELKEQEQNDLGKELLKALGYITVEALSRQREATTERLIIRE